MGTTQHLRISDDTDFLTEIKKYGTDISFYLACQGWRLPRITPVHLKYRVKAVLLYPFHEHHPEDYSELYDPQWKSGYSCKVPTNLLSWIPGLFGFLPVLSQYLVMVNCYSRQKVLIREATEDLFRLMERHMGDHAYACTFMEILKHMQRTGTIKRILPKMNKSKLFGVGFLHAYFTGSLCQYLDKYYFRWDWTHTKWLETLLLSLTEKDCNKILASLPWTRVMFLLSHTALGETTWSYAVSVIPACMCALSNDAVPSLLSLCLVNVVPERSNFFAENKVHELSLLEQLANNIPHDLAEAIPLLLLLMHQPEFLNRSWIIFAKILFTAFGWLARRQLLSQENVSGHVLRAWQAHAPAISDDEILHFARLKSTSQIAYYLNLDWFQQEVPERQRTLLTRYVFRRSAQQQQGEVTVHTAKS